MNPSQNTPYFEDPDPIIAREKEGLQLAENEKVFGLALSGGGIRSASFGLGVLQALVGKDHLKKFHYLSTVSGGGYLGSALTYALSQLPPEHSGTSADDFPLGKKNVGNRNSSTANQLLDFIRQHGNYLLPSDAMGAVSFAAVVFRGIFLSLLAYFSLTVVLISSLRWLFDLVFNTWLAKNDANPFLGDNWAVFFIGAGLCLSFYLVRNIYYSFAVAFKSSSYSSFIRGQKRAGKLWQYAFGLLLVGSVPVVANYGNAWFHFDVVMAGGSSVLGTAMAIWQYLKAIKKDKDKSPTSGYILFLGAFGLIYGLAILAYHVSYLIYAKNTNPIHNEHWWYLALLFLFSVLYSWFTDLNMVGPHRVYRNRLMEVFMPDKLAKETNRWMPAPDADEADLSTMCWQNKAEKHTIRKPYHILNTNLILCNSTQVKYRGRAGDNFVLSPLYCGSDATGWLETPHFKNHGSSELSLATAMAVSGAALNPNAGVSGEGITRNKILSLLLSALNLRLGLWTMNPKKYKPEKLTNNGNPNYFNPGFSGEILRNGYKETSSWIMLSDGGHFENLGLYELVRRKADVILVADGGADPGFNFDDLGNAIEKVRVDFGVKIRFREDDANGGSLDGILFKAGENGYENKYQVASRAFAVADVYYPGTEEKKGILFYLKLAMIPDLPSDVYSYKGVNPEFPHQSTGDQFFNEKQFEAYRELGYAAANQMMGDNTWNSHFYPN